MRFPIAIYAIVLAGLVAACGGSAENTGIDPTQPPVDGLLVRVTGPIDGGAICPGGYRPCLEPVGDGASDLVDGDQVRLVGVLDGGRLRITEVEEPPAPFRIPPDQCDDKTEGSSHQVDVSEAVIAYGRSVPDQYVVVWTSPTAVLHFGVVGDAASHEAAIADLGFGDDVCVVGGFPRSDAELQAAQEAIGVVMRRWSETGLVGSIGAGGNHWEGTVDVELYRIDASMVDELTAAAGDVVRVNAGIEVMEGTLADLDIAIGEIPPSTDPAADPTVTMTCGLVEFTSIPADLDEFPPLGDEAQAVLVAASEGPAGAGYGSLLDDWQWSDASSAPDQLVLFGQAKSDENYDPQSGLGRYIEFVFERSGEDWFPYRSGSCRLAVSATGLGPAAMILDPDRKPDPASTELPVLIQERACASGSAPVDREIVPVVTETDSTIEIAMLVAPVKGGAQCPGNPWHPTTVMLASPLGERTVIDASTQPGIERTWPPTEFELSD